MSPRTPAPFWRTLAALVALFAAFGLAQGCTEIPYNPVIVVPPAPVVPVDPVTPGPVVPVDPAQVVPYATASRVAPGMTYDAVKALVGFPAAHTAPRDDGTTGALWAATGPTGAARWLQVIFGADGLSLPHALLPRPE
jgi:hypothetical protein